MNSTDGELNNYCYFYSEKIEYSTARLFNEI